MNIVTKIAPSRQFQRRLKSIQDKLACLSDLLRHQGSFVKKRIKGHPYWYLRVYETSQTGVRIHRSIFIGCDEQIVAKVRELLATFRAEQAEHEQLLALSRSACRLCRRLLKLIKS